MESGKQVLRGNLRAVTSFAFAVPLRFCPGTSSIRVVSHCAERKVRITYPGYFIRTRNYGGGLGETDRAMG